MNRATSSVLSYWRDWFDPDRRAPGANHSTGLIAAGLHRLLTERGVVEYLDHAQRPTGRRADLFVGHFWAFAPMTAANTFDRSIAVYVLSDPDVARARLTEAARRLGVPMPHWDLPPHDFDHRTTMDRADLVLLCGNRATAATFPSRWQHKLRLFNYSLDEELWPVDGADGSDGDDDDDGDHRRDFVYVATHCGLRKGFMDLIETWRTIPPQMARCHVIGRLDPPFDRLLAEADVGSVVVHGWIESSSDRYRDLLRSCRFAYVPTWIEGQMGTMLEAVFAGCIPLTTAACGIDDEVLQHCVELEPMQPAQHRARIEEVLGWTPGACRLRRRSLLAAAARQHRWAVFDQQVGAAIDEVLAR